MIILDTNVLSESFRVAPDPSVVLFVAETTDLATTAISVLELLGGVSELPHGRRRALLTEAIEGTLSVFSGRVIAYDAAAARAHAHMIEETRAKGRPMSLEDGMIAAICRSRGATLATRNVKDFEMLGLEVVNPWGAA